MKHAQRRPWKQPASRPSLLERIQPNAAGIDCGSAEHYVAVPADRDATPVRSFPTVTAELHRLADWLTACGVTTVAMESTGVYWIPLYEILEARGLDVVLVNAHHVKNVPGCIGGARLQAEGREGRRFREGLFRQPGLYPVYAPAMVHRPRAGPGRAHDRQIMVSRG